MRKCLTAVLLLCAAAALHAQAPNRRIAIVPSEPAVTSSGTVTGRVFCTDTQRPAKFAEVQLLQARDTNSTNAPAGSPAQFDSLAQGRTALDGSFSISGVPPGDYYAVANATGYVSPVTVARQTNSSLRAPQVHVDANRSSDVLLSIERGGVIAGRVLFDDGTPAAGVGVQIRTSGAATQSFPTPGFAFGGRFSFGGSQQTDERGVFRISGVPPGKYNVAATLQAEGTERVPGRRPGQYPQTITVYAPATMREAEARTVELRGADTIEGIDIQVALTGLHTVRGVVEAKGDAHPLNSGFATLVDSTDGLLARLAQIGTDGTFAVEYLPSGTYKLHVIGTERGADTGRRGSMNGPQYQPITLTVVVGDHDVVLDPTLLESRAPVDAAPAPAAPTP